MSEKPKTRSKLRNFQVSIVIVIFSLVIPTVSIITAYTYFTSRSAALELAQSMAEKLTDTITDKTLTYLQPAEVIAQETSHLFMDPTRNFSSASDLEPFMIGVVEAQPQVDFFYFGSEEGFFSQWIHLKDKKQFLTRHIELRDKRNPQIAPVSGDTTLTAAQAPHYAKAMVQRYFDEETKELVKEDIAFDFSYRPRDRGWYKAAKATNKLIWTEPYAFASVETFGITAAMPVKDRDGNLRGVVAADITLPGLCEFLQKNKLSPGSIALIADASGDLVAFPDHHKMVRRKAVEKPKILSVEQMGIPWVSSAWRQHLDTNQNQIAFRTEGIDYLAFFQPVPAELGKNWKIVVIIPEDDFLGGVKGTLHFILVVSALVLIASVLAGVLFARNLSRPIEKLTVELRQIQRLELESEVKVKSYIYEIQLISDATEAMKIALRSFQRYIPVELVHQLFSSGVEAVPGGAEHELTLMFTDIADFTSITEELPPKELMVDFSEYLDLITRPIRDHRGTIDKYIGDAVMVFWGAPVPNPEHALDACRAAVACRDVARSLNATRRLKNKPPFVTRFGLHTGFTILGNMGSDERLNYTVLGDSVNLASRLEGVNKHYGTEIIISQATYRYIRNDFIVRPLDIVAVKGKVAGVMIFELMGEHNSENADALEPFADSFREAFDLYHDRQWDAALEKFTALQETHPDDIPLKLYVERCTNYLDNDPGPDWSGLTRLTSK